MTTRPMVTLDGNEAVASVAHRVSEVIAIYPITPSSTMGEFSDEWSAQGKKNVWGTVPLVSEMQSEGGASGAVHGALQAGALTTTFTASQGLLLMIPNMYKIAGELTPFVMHVSARCVATHALSIFGDHSDVMACRQTGFAMLASSNLQEAHDLAAVAHPATLMAKLPFIHFFDGFRTSREVAKIELLQDEDLLAMVSEDLVSAQRKRALTPDAPVLRGTAQNPDCFFQAREACNPYYDACAGKVQEAMDAFAKLTGRAYRLFDYVGHPEAERVIIIMGSGADVTHETVEYLLGKGEKVGVLKVRLYRPFDASAFIGALPKSVKAIAVLDRTKEPGSVGEPLFQDVVTVLRNAREDGTSPFAVEPKVVGGRYGLASKEFTPAMVKGVFDELAKAKPKRDFTVGIVDDVTHLSLKWDPEFDTEPASVTRGVFFGLGADGTVGANKNSIKIIGEETDNYAQGYFVYDSKKSGGITISHLRFGPKPIRSSYLVKTASFVACHQFGFLEKYDVLEYAAPGAVFLLNSLYGPDEVWDKLPVEVQEQLIAKKIRFYVIDGYEVGDRTGMGRRINTIMQTCFFAISGVLPREEAIYQIKKSIEKTYGKKGAELVRMNFEAVDQTLANLHEVKVPAAATSTAEDAADRPDRGSRLRPEDHGDHAREQGRPPPRLGLPGRRHLRHGDGAVGEAEHRHRDPGVGREALHPVQQVRDGLPARGDPRQGLRPRPAREGPGDLQVGRLPRPRVQGDEVHDPGRPGRLHGLQPLRGRLPRQGQGQPAAQGPRHGGPGAAARGRARQLQVLPRPPRARPDEAEGRRQELAVHAAPLRVLGRLRRLRRDPLHQAGDAALRRPDADRQRHRLLVDLRREPPDDPLHREPRRPRPGLGELPLRGQRRVRVRHAPRPRQAGRARRRARQGAGRPPRRRARLRPPDGRPGDRAGDRPPARARRGSQGEARRRRRPPGPPPPRHRRLPREEEPLDHRRRRLGLRHRLRRPRPRPGAWAGT